MKTTIHFSQDDDIIDIRKDNIFKAVFTQDIEPSRMALSKFVSALIGHEVEIIAITANEPPVGNVRDRQIRFDINCKAGNGELINVEMSLNPKPFEPVRMEFHLGKLFTGQNIKGKNKDYDDLERAYQISVLAKKRFFPDGEFYHAFEYYDPLNNVSLNGRTRIITIELSKLEKVVEKSAEEMNSCEHWAVFFQYLTDRSKREKINEIAKYEEGIAMAGKLVMGFSKEEEEHFRIMAQEKAELDWQSEMVYARKTGRAEGREEKQKEIARNALAEGLSLDIVQKITGLDLSTIENLQK